MKKGAKSPKKPKKPSAGKAAAPQEEDRDLTMADESMEPAQGWDFVAEKLPARKKQKFLSKLASRYSALSGRWQRYNLRFGYYTKGGLPNKEKFAVTSANNATIPGQLANEKGKHYRVSRSWSIRPKQVSDVLRAAESYADRGGYNPYTRNCTTFAKEMIVDAAKIKSAAGVFAKDEVYLHKKADAKMFAAGALAPLAKGAVENGFEKIGHKDDLSYQNFGNKMASKEDHARYRKSVKFLFSAVPRQIPRMRSRQT